MPLPPELELWKVKLNAFHRLSWKFVEGLLSGVLLISKEHKIKNFLFSCVIFLSNYFDTR